MDFKNKISQVVLRFLPKRKISIRLSILSILLILLVSVSISIIGINYFSVNSILIKSSKSHLTQASGRVAEQVSGYLSPLNSSSSIAHRMLNKGLMVPNRSARFTQFLYSLIADNHLSGAYWGDAQGNLYWFNRGKDGGFVQEIISREKGGVKASLKSVDSEGNILGIDNDTVPSLQDSRLRPWYKQAHAAKKPIWVVYQFAPIEGQKSQLGVTAAQPVYDNAGNLKGVFCIDILLGDIVNYIRDIDITKHSHIFIVDESGRIIAARGDQEHLLDYKKLHMISDLNAKWLQESFDIYQKDKENSFIFSSGHKDYVSDYEEISGVLSKQTWHVGIVTPIDDIVAPLKTSSFIALLLTLVVLVFGIIMASIFSASISNPVKKLAQDANFICQLKLESVKQVFSSIKEITEMGDAFMRMKSALYSFQRYMPIALVKKLVISNKIAEVGGESKELTLLFSDIENFTGLSENFDPEKLMKYLSEYFQCVTKVIIDVGGTLDKYIGDSVMAFWGAPIDDEDHALHACNAAIQMQKALGELNLKWRKEGKPEIVTRVGINTGQVVVGNVGSDDRINYTSLGDQVNLASRLEGINKIYGTTMMVSEFTYEKVKHYFNFRLLDKVAVKGRTQGVYVYELLGEKYSEKPDLKLEQYNEDFYQAFHKYFEGDWNDALKLFNVLDKKYPDDKVIKLFIERCAKFISNPPESWNGNWIMEGK